jgi:FkbM family methyltransferase
LSTWARTGVINSIEAARRVGSGGRVIAFEPNPETLVRLRRNLALSDVANIVSVQAVACFEKPSRLMLFLRPGANTGESSLSGENASQEGAARAVEVDPVPLDEILETVRVSRVDVIKMDIEGAEVTALRGATRTLARYRPALVLEVDDHHLHNMGTSEGELRAFLDAAGYMPGFRLGRNVTWAPRER